MLDFVDVVDLVVSAEVCAAFCAAFCGARVVDSVTVVDQGNSVDFLSEYSAILYFSLKYLHQCCHPCTCT